MYSLKFTLKQHTPLIHFQHFQEGATLRASEVKPKLDRFINDKFKDLDINFQDKKNKSLLYRIRIETNKIVVLPDEIPTFFGNMGVDKNENKKLLTYFPQGVKIEISSYHLDLITLLKKSINEFFTLNHFGTRQSKGFGMFLVESIDDKPLVFNNENHFETILLNKYTDIYKKNIDIKNCNNIHDLMVKVFSTIDNEYKKLKAGIGKSKSKIRSHFNEKRPVIEWEKPTMQEFVNDNNRKKINVDSISEDRQYVRALLGLAQTFEYPHNDNIKFNVSHKTENDKIERFQSPIQVKYWNGSIYFCATEFDSKQRKIFDKKFIFSPPKTFKFIGKIPEMKTPNSFYLLDFLEEALINNFIKLERL